MNTEKYEKEFYDWLEQDGRTYGDDELQKAFSTGAGFGYLAACEKRFD